MFAYLNQRDATMMCSVLSNFGEARTARGCGCSTALFTPFVAPIRPQTLRSQHCSLTDTHVARSRPLSRNALRPTQGFHPVSSSIEGPAVQNPTSTSSATRTAMTRPPGRPLLVTRTIEAAQTLETPTASLSRVVYATVQPARVARTASSGRSGSPLSTAVTSALVLALTVGTAAAAALRARLRAVRECHACHGYGVQRCKLCSGKGTIEWEGKMAHREPCPMCLGRRMNSCACCGGGPILARNLFKHTRKHGADGQPTFGAQGPLAGQSPRIVATLRRLRGLEDNEEARLEQSEKFKEEIMMD